jgi:cytochrome P450
MATDQRSWKTDAAPLPPLAAGLPILGNALSMADNPLRFFIRLYHEYGPIFRIRVLNRTYTVMGGLDANRFMISANDTFSSKEILSAMGRELGTERLLLAMDGPAHLRRRKSQRRGYSRDSMVPQLPKIIDMATVTIKRWQPGQTVVLYKELQPLIVRQLGLILTQHDAEAYIDDIRAVMHANLFINVAQAMPVLLLKHPSYTRARARLMEFGREILEYHRTVPVEQRLPDLVDDLLAERDENGRALSDQEVIAETIGSFNAGLDTISGTCAFLLYAILKEPGLLERIQSEVDQAFVRGQVSLGMFKEMPVLHAAAMETLRLYPVAPFMLRCAAKAFEFAGCRVDQGTTLFVVPTLTHFLPEYFPQPDRFDVDRYKDEGQKSRPANVFAPFMLGAHTCLGAGMAETQVMLLTALLIHSVDLRLEPTDYEAKMRFTPVPNPGNKLRARVIGHRH